MRAERLDRRVQPRGKPKLSTAEDTEDTEDQPFDV